MSKPKKPVSWADLDEFDFEVEDDDLFVGKQIKLEKYRIFCKLQELSKKLFQDCESVQRVHETGMKTREQNAMICVDFNRLSIINPSSVQVLTEMMQMSDFVLFSRPYSSNEHKDVAEITFGVHDIWEE